MCRLHQSNIERQKYFGKQEVSPDLENLLGRKPASLKAGLKVLFKF